MAHSGGENGVDFYDSLADCKGIGASVKVGELQLAGDLGSKCDPATIPCVFAPDDSRVAWSCGQRRVVILPWNRHRSCLVRDNDKNATGAPLDDREVVISTGLDVCTMTFWMGCQRQSGGARRGSWKRFDFTQTPLLATGHPNGRIRLWSVVSGSLLLELMDHRGAVRDLQFAPDASLRLVSASADKTIKAWDLSDDGNMYKTLSECRVPLLRCGWRPDGRQLVVCGRSKLLYVFDMVLYKRSMVLEGHRHEATSCSFSYDGSLIISSSLDTRAIVWDAATGAPLRTMFHLNPPPRLIFAAGENGAWVSCAVMSRSMCQAATVCEDGLLRFWNVWEDGEEPAVPVTVPRLKEDETLNSCIFNSTGSVVAVGGGRLTDPCAGSTIHGSVSFFTVPQHVPPLVHLARRAVRLLTSGDDVQKLPLPAGIRAYLRYAA